MAADGNIKVGDIVERVGAGPRPYREVRGLFHVRSGSMVRVAAGSAPAVPWCALAPVGAGEVETTKAPLKDVALFAPTVGAAVAKLLKLRRGPTVADAAFQLGISNSRARAELEAYQRRQSPAARRSPRPDEAERTAAALKRSAEIGDIGYTTQGRGGPARHDPARAGEIGVPKIDQLIRLLSDQQPHVRADLARALDTSEEALRTMLSTLRGWDARIVSLRGSYGSGAGAVRMVTPPTDARKRVRSIAEQVRAALDDSAERTAADLRLIVGDASANVHAAMQQLRRRGAVIESRPVPGAPGAQKLYRMTTPPVADRRTIQGRE